MRSVLIYIIQEVEELREKVKAARSESISLRKSMDEFRCVNERNNNDVPGVVARLRVQVQQVQQVADEIRYDLMRIRVEKQSSEESHAQEIAELHKRLPELSDSKSRGINKQDEMRHKEECKGLLIQITYLKAKFYRESAFRSDLQFTKRYLLSLYGAALSVHRRLYHVQLILTSFPGVKHVVFRYHAIHL